MLAIGRRQCFGYRNACQRRIGWRFELWVAAGWANVGQRHGRRVHHVILPSGSNVCNVRHWGESRHSALQAQAPLPKG